MSLEIIILAAGQGTRMKSALPKVLHPIAGRPMLAHVLDTAKSLQGNISVVVGHGAEKVQQTFSAENINWVQQEQQRGTGHAVMQAMPGILSNGITLVLYGDVPLTQKETLEKLLKSAEKSSLAILTVSLANPKGYGRIIRDATGKVCSIVEEKDATDSERAIREVNTGIIAINTSLLHKLLPKISDKNAQGEYYLTDIIKLAVVDGVEVGSLCAESETEVQGVNDKIQLQQLERACQLRQAEELMRQGATILDSLRIDIRGNVQVGRDVSIDINCLFQGNVVLGDGVSIGPNCVIGEPGHKVVIGNHSEIRANTIIEDAVIGESCVVGPFARLRPGTFLHARARIGNFVETKKADIGEGSKVNHLTYIGDTRMGRDVNIGAGTITCNYDGVNKFETVIGDRAFIGSNTSIVAPVKIGEEATIAAGSTVNQDVANGELAVARSRQKNIEGWERPKKG